MTITDEKLEHLNERCQRLEKAFAELPRISELIARLWERDPHHFSARPCQTCNAISNVLDRPFGCMAPEEKSVASCVACDRVGKGDTLYWWATVSLTKRDPKRLDEKMIHRELHICDHCWESLDVWGDLIKRFAWLKDVVGDEAEEVP